MCSKNAHALHCLRMRYLISVIQTRLACISLLHYCECWYYLLLAKKRDENSIYPHVVRRDVSARRRWDQHIGYKLTRQERTSTWLWKLVENCNNPAFAYTRLYTTSVSRRDFESFTSLAMALETWRVLHDVVHPTRGRINLYFLVTLIVSISLSPVYEGCSKNKVTFWFSQKILIYWSIFMFSPSK